MTEKHELAHRGHEYVSTIQARIAEVAQRHPNEALTTLHHYLTTDLLRESCRRLRKNAAAGVDDEDVATYERELEKRLPELLTEIKTGRYRAPPALRGYIPKPGTDEKRPLGIPAVEDKTVEKAVTLILGPIYEQEFLPCSYGFRPGIGALDAIRAMHAAIRREGTKWIVEVDIRKFFDRLSHKHLRAILRQRVRDGVILRLIDKWLKAGVIEAGAWQATEEGTPQGGIISPLLANLYLHEVLDKWFVEQIRPRLKGRCFLIRYADDFVMGFETEEDARRVMEVLPKRFARFDTTTGAFCKPGACGSVGRAPTTLSIGCGFGPYCNDIHSSNPASFTISTVRVNASYEEPDAGNLHVRVCGGAAVQPAALPGKGLLSIDTVHLSCSEQVFCCSATLRYTSHTYHDRFVRCYVRVRLDCDRSRSKRLSVSISHPSGSRPRTGRRPETHLADARPANRRCRGMSLWSNTYRPGAEEGSCE